MVKISNPPLKPKALRRILDSKFNKALSLHQEERFIDAQLVYGEILKLEPGNPDALHLMGLTFYFLKSYKSAIQFINQAIDIHPYAAPYFSNRGLSYQAIKDYESALEDYKNAIKIQPNFGFGYLNQGALLLDLNKVDSAITSLEMAILFMPENPAAYYTLGNAKMSLKDYAGGLINYNKAILLNPNFYNAIYNRGLALFQLNRFQDALSDFDSCNTSLSKAEGLLCLNALGEHEEIYTRIDKLSQEDDVNISIAAISSFVAENKKRNTSHNFCKNPLDFLYFNNISPDINNAKSFINETIEELRDIDCIWEPANKSTHNGFQAGIDLFENPKGKMLELQTLVLNELKKYHLKFKSEECTFIQKWPSEMKITGWHVVLKKQGYQSAHIHPSGWLSGVIYLKVVPSLDQYEGAIEFGLEGDKYKFSHATTKKIMYNPKEGDIVLFPSSLHHKTIPFTSDRERIIVAFDLLPTANQ